MNFVYFIGYYWWSPKSEGWGNSIVTVDGAIHSIQNIHQLEQTVSAQNHNTKTIITSITLLSMDSKEDDGT